MDTAMPVESQFGVHGQSARGRLRADGATSEERNFAVAVHLSPFAALFFQPAIVAPLVLWLIKKDSSVFVDDHGRETLNFLISFLLWHVVLLVTLVGIILWPVLWVVAVVNLIRGAVAAGNGEYFRYPMTIRVIT